MGLEVIIPILCLVIGLAIGYFICNSSYARKAKEIEELNREKINDAKERANEIKKNAKYEAKQIIRDEKEKLQEEFRKKERKLDDKERGMDRKEAMLETKLENVSKESNKLQQKSDQLDIRWKKVDEEVARYKLKQEEITTRLSEISQLSRQEAKQELVDRLTDEAKVDAAKEISRIEDEAKEEAEKKAKKVIAVACQRFAGEFVAEDTISSVELPGDEIKGRIIGREGRNIRAFEQICGVDLIVDDTPGLVVLSSFNVIRKEIARKTLERLVSDGRIHPAKIEEFYEKSKSELEATAKDLGEKAQMEIGVHGMHPEVLKMLGALNWRTSYTQNQYQHSLEVGFLCGAMAGELGMNVKQARRAGLLHDIGKVMDASMEGSHAMVGADFLKKYGESPDIVHAVRAHHEDVKPETVLAHLVMAGDALSGGRPGIRKSMKESYISRLTDLENIVNSFEGVSRSYAISAGREVRVLVDPERISDKETIVLSRDIAKKIEEEMSYPGTIKINVLRETKSVGVAR